MPSNKNRLYVALYPSGVSNNEERKYHWAFLIGPKAERGKVVPGTRYHVRNSAVQWKYEENELENVQNTTNLLARILIAKIEDEQRLIALLRQLPVIQGDPNWRCRTWIASALAAMAEDGKCVGTAKLDWQKIEALARQYVKGKVEAGRYQSGEDVLGPRPTWDMLENKETVA
ncbi:hypothetical protein F5Y10DRAFT_273405 [Nemania abortiva]|nr:hypothetical protein F5Y10DRAFT_273405 [Nemania abortiva]